MESYVLVVDDFPDGRDMLAEYLTFRGFTVATATDGAEAFKLAVERPPSIILMDLTMPGLDGWEATRRLKAHAKTKDSIIIAVTANALAPDEGRALGAGADGFVAKPYDLTLLGDALQTIATEGRSALNALPGSIAPATSGSREYSS